MREKFTIHTRRNEPFSESLLAGPAGQVRFEPNTEGALKLQPYSRFGDDGFLNLLDCTFGFLQEC